MRFKGIVQGSAQEDSPVLSITLDNPSIFAERSKVEKITKEKAGNWNAGKLYVTIQETLTEVKDTRYSWPDLKWPFLKL